MWDINIKFSQIEDEIILQYRRQQFEVLLKFLIEENLFSNDFINFLSPLEENPLYGLVFIYWYNNIIN